MVPMLLRLPTHHQQRPTAQREVPAGRIWVNRAAAARTALCFSTNRLPELQHPPHLESCSASDANAANGWSRAKEGTSVCVPGNVVVAVQVEPYENRIERHSANIPALLWICVACFCDFIRQSLQKWRNGYMGFDARDATKIVCPGWIGLLDCSSGKTKGLGSLTNKVSHTRCESACLCTLLGTRG